VIRVYVVAGICAAFLAGAGAFLTKLDSWYYQLRKPSWQPPDWLFGPAWSLIFALSAFAGGRAWLRATSSGEHGAIAATFACNALLNMIWSVLFFRYRRPDWALIEVAALWLSILAMMAATAPITTAGALCLLPYLLWVSFASYLNLTIVRLNRPFQTARLIA
jgi:tryptophan-rich sensory protein